MLLGHLGAEPELRFTQSGQAVLNMRLATTESYLDSNKVRQERTEWHSVVLWGKRAEALAKFLQKGSMLFVEGGLRTTSYEKDGQKRYKTEVNATNVILAGKGGGEASEKQPRHTGGASVASAPDSARADDMPIDDDIPF
jgi:single-strand DNA-binding protein